MTNKFLNERKEAIKQFYKNMQSDLKLTVNNGATTDVNKVDKADLKGKDNKEFNESEITLKDLNDQINSAEKGKKKD